MQKNGIKVLLTVLIAACFLIVSAFALCQDVNAAGQVELKVLDPRAELMSTPAAPINPRLKTLDGIFPTMIIRTRPMN